MSEKPHNPPAFPIIENGKTTLCEDYGMSLRDYFAAAALQGLVWLEPEPYKIGETPRCATKTGVAEIAYEFADAMLKARES